MTLCVKNILIQRYQLWIVTEQKVQILQSLGQKETLHLVTEARIPRVLDIADGGVAAVWNPGVLFKGVEDLPAPLTVFLVARQAVQHKQTL